MEISFKNKKALVTGASKGIGREVAVKLAKFGAKVVALGRSQSDLDSLKEIDSSIQTFSVELRDWKITREIISQVVKDVDLLVNSAGEGLVKGVLDVEETDIDRIFDLNVKALMNVTQMVVADMLARKAPGSIVNLSSQAGLVGLNCHTVYCASKGAVDAYTRALALELGSHNIRVNSVNPTVVLTEMGRKWWSDPSRGTDMLAKIPLRRFAEVDEVVDTVLFLLSDKAGMITGSCIPIDGGFVNT